jgi:hypothetical protein
MQACEKHCFFRVLIASAANAAHAESAFEVLVSSRHTAHKPFCLFCLFGFHCRKHTAMKISFQSKNLLAELATAHAKSPVAGDLLT